MECNSIGSLRPGMSLFLLVALWPLYCSASSPKSGNNFTRESCLSFERTNSIRRSTKLVTVSEHSPAYLHCSIDGGDASSDNLVAWTRLTDDALLTAGGRSFTTDARFQISPKRQARDWVLIIRRVQKSDEGCYMCEINTEPLTTLIPVYVEVLSENEAPQRLSSTQKRNSNLSTKMVAGNVLLLNCSVEDFKGLHSREHNSDTDIMWTKDNNPIDLSDDKKYFTEISHEHNGRGFVYTLRITDVSSYDDGLYACEGEGLAKSAQMVHVNTSGASSMRFSFCSLLILLACNISHIYVHRT